MIALIVVVALVAIVGFCLWGFNTLRRKSINVDEGYAQIEVQLTRRADLIPQLVETVKGYASHEKTVLEELTRARAAVSQAKSSHEISQTASADGQLDRALVNVNAVAEKYPDLKASANFLALQEELTATENKVAFARQYYNESVRQLNTAISTMPTMLFVGIAGVEKREFYEVPDAAQRQAPDVDLS